MAKLDYYICQITGYKMYFERYSNKKKIKETKVKRQINPYNV